MSNYIISAKIKTVIKIVLLNSNKSFDKLIMRAAYKYLNTVF